MKKLQLILHVGLLGYASTALAADDQGPRRNVLENLDSNGDEQISLIEFQDRDNNALTAMDNDQNGVLTIDEFINTLPDNMGMRMGRGDNSGNAPRSQREPDAEQLAKMQEMRTQRATARFTAMDNNGDEIVTLEEFQTGMFAELDRDDNGVLTAEELRPPRMGRPGANGERPRGPRGDLTDAPQRGPRQAPQQ